MIPARAAFWLVFAVTLGVYLVMLLWTLPAITAAAGGLAPFDLRPTGYSFDEARAFLAALTPEGTALYRTVQQRLDIAYPALLAATLVLAILLLSPSGLGRWRWLLAATALPGMVFDYLENAAVAAMLDGGAAALTPELAQAANRWTLLKSAFSTLAFTVLLVLLARWLFRRVLHRRRGALPVPEGRD